MKSFAFILAVAIFSATSGATSFQDEITKSFPSFKLLEKVDFTPEILKISKGNPGLIEGKFQPASKNDFAALIRSEKKNPSGSFDGKLIVCIGQTAAFKCSVIEKMELVLPMEAYLLRTGRKKTGCYEANGTKRTLDVKTDAIGYYFPEKGGSDFIFQDDGSFLNCVTSD